jgi:hypothetical protein
MNFANIQMNLKKLCSVALLACCALLLGCAAPLPSGYSRAPLPGDAQFYSFGIAQSVENFANVKRAQDHYALHTTQRTWQDIKPMVAPATYNMLQIYYPLSVRWELKDGRQFILENIDVGAIMREYFKTNRIVLPHQKEGRPRGDGDFNPSLVHEVKDDTVILKWLIRINKTPPSERFKPNGAANQWQFAQEQHIVTTLKGKPTNGIDFEKWFESNKKQ